MNTRREEMERNEMERGEAVENAGVSGGAGDLHSEVRLARMEIPSVPERLAELRKIAEEAGVRIICMNAEMMAGRGHAEEAIRQAIRAEEEGTMTARSLEMEVLLYASGQRQTSIAMGFGLHEGEMLTWIGMVPPSEKAWAMLAPLISPCPDEEEIPPARIPALQELYGITDDEIRTVGSGRIAELVIERTALLNILK